MSSIDERIVGMKFDNAQFQKGVAETNKSLDTLKQGLNLDAAKKSLAGLSSEAGKFTLQGIGNAVDGIASKFTALGVVGVTALATITSQAVNAGVAMAKSLTIDPIMDGFGEYELTMGSIQTILSNTARYGTTLDQVTGSLGELNTYADKTIYNFGDMTKNIGLFTNAGIRIEDATSMIKGFSNEAAASGTSAQGAAGAAYQLSQALSAGKVTLMDWRSLQNVGMGNKNMQSGIIEIAQAMGTLENAGTSSEEVTANFNGTLEKGWLTSDVMSTYLKIMAGDMDSATQASLGLSDATIATFAGQQKMSEEAATKVRTYTQLVGTLREAVGSSWSQTFNILFGDFNEATELFTNVNNVLGGMIGAAGDARNALLTGWDQLGGRAALIEALGTAFNILMDIIKPIGEAFREVFAPLTDDTLAQLTFDFRDFINSLKPAPADLENIKRIFVGIFSVLNVGWAIVKGVFSIFGKLVGTLGKAIGPLLGFAASLAAPGDAINDFLGEGGKLESWFNTAGDFLVKPLEVLGDFVNGVVDWVKTLQGVNVGEVFDGAGEAVNQVVPFQAIGEKIALAWEWVKRAWSAVVEFFTPMAKAIGDFFGEVGPPIYDAIKNLDFDLLLNAINTGLFAGLVLMFKGFLGNFKGLFSKGEGGGLGSIKDLFKDTFGGITDTLSAMQDQLKAKTLITIAIALAILTASVIALSFIDPGRLTAALTALTVMFTQLGASMGIFQKIIGTKSFAQMPLVAASLILLGAALLILSASVKVLADLDWNELARGLTGVTVLLALMVGVAKTMQKSAPTMVSASVGMIAIGLAIRVLAEAVAKFSELSWDEMIRGLVGVGLTLTALAIFTKVAAVNKGAVANAVGLIALGTALRILGLAVAAFAVMDAGQMTQGLAAVAAVLVMLTLFTKIADGKSIGVTSVAMVILASAMQILASVVQQFGSMDLGAMAQGLIGMGAALGIVAVAMSLMSGSLLSSVALVVVSAALLILVGAFKQMAELSWDEIGRGMVVLGGSLAILAAAMALMGIPIVLLGAIGITAAAFAMMMLAPALKLLGSMSWDDIGRGLTVLAAGLVIMAAGGILLLPAIPAFMGLGIAVALLGAGALAAGVGITMFATGLALLGTVGLAGAAGITAIMVAIIALIPMAMTALANGIIAFANVIATSGPQLVSAITTMLMSMITAIGNVMPTIISTLVNLLLQLIAGLTAVIPPLIEFAVLMITTLVNAIVTLVPFLVDAGLRMITGILEGIASNIAGIVTAGVDIVLGFIKGVGDNIPKVIQAAADLILDFVNGLADGIRNNTAAMNEAGANLASAIIEGMTSGIMNGIDSVVSAAQEMAGNALDAAKNFLQINSPSKKFIKVGEGTGEGMVKGMENMSGDVADSATNMGRTALSAMKLSMSRVNEAVASDLDMQPTIRPVMDLTAFKKGAGQLNGMVATAPSLSVDTTNSRAAYISSKFGTPGQKQEAGMGNITKGDSSKALTFIQNNYSPKALNRLDLYRNTNNQFALAKEVLEI